MQSIYGIKVKLLKTIFHLIGLLAFIWLIYAIYTQKFSSDPSKDIQHFTGITTLRLLIILALIPMVAFYLKLNTLFQVRKPLGLWCFFWANLHLASYLLLEIGWENITFFFSEVFSRIYLIIGALCWIILLLMAISSFDWLKNKFNQEWKRIHSLFYPLLLLVCIHYFLSLKSPTPEPIIYLIIIGLTYLFRFWQQKKNKSTNI
ncbi:protein-methionine-sulfoxide reductase heme-binding subunit MsrQ [Proteus faecis]|uniref:protein-methionine-sulfoxide reductase heme-binding subunit MsrQ n=2 Tax=Proteus faecis TaxID=2050967 RepID=UPI000D69CBE3|nr:protein-methionine-sulfoxide reductase heme-binding subunit MsrQ [Proteus faecis]MBG3013948.1 sulfoxide reductase heme-binding subunit YedZ [Proteus mirabilis]